MSWFRRSASQPERPPRFTDASQVEAAIRSHKRWAAANAAGSLLFTVAGVVPPLATFIAGEVHGEPTQNASSLFLAGAGALFIAMRGAENVAYENQQAAELAQHPLLADAQTPAHFEMTITPTTPEPAPEQAAIPERERAVTRIPLDVV